MDVPGQARGRLAGRDSFGEIAESVDGSTVERSSREFMDDLPRQILCFRVAVLK
jgi:hypothetical protein